MREREREDQFIKIYQFMKRKRILYFDFATSAFLEAHIFLFFYFLLCVYKIRVTCIHTYTRCNIVYAFLQIICSMFTHDDDALDDCNNVDN